MTSTDLRIVARTNFYFLRKGALRLVFLSRRSGTWKYYDEAAEGWMGDKVSDNRLFAVVTVESAREDFGCVVPSNPRTP